MDKKTYTKIKRTDVDRLRSDLGKYGITIPEGDDVEVAGPLGVKMRVSYNETAEQLDLAIVDKPSYVTESQIWRVVEMGAGKLNGSS
jgi:hypothetical protein